MLLRVIMNYRYLFPIFFETTYPLPVSHLYLASMSRTGNYACEPPLCQWYFIYNLSLHYLEQAKIFCLRREIPNPSSLSSFTFMPSRGWPDWKSTCINNLYTTLAGMKKLVLEPASILNCEPGSFLFSYLGFLIKMILLNRRDWQ